MSVGNQQKGPLAEVVATCKRAFLPLVLFSMGINLLMLTPALYMLQVYDRVLSSRSLETLMALTLIALLALVTMAALEARDGKGLYAAARAGKMADVVGVDIPFPNPEQPDLVIRNDGPGLDAANIAADILARTGAAS